VRFTTPIAIKGKCQQRRIAAERRRQTGAFAKLDAIMEIGSRAPAARAADIVLASLRPTDARK